MIMELTVRELKNALGDYPVIADAVKDLSDDTEIRLGDIMINPDAIAGVIYDRKWLKQVVQYAGYKGTNEEIEEVLGSCDFDDLIMDAVADAVWEAAEAACEKALS